MVGRPCGQFQGCSIVAIFATTLSIWPLSKAFPIMIELRHARLANMARAFGNLTISPGLLFSATIEASSWTSSTPNCVPLLKGTAVILSFFVVGSSSSTYCKRKHEDSVFVKHRFVELRSNPRETSGPTTKCWPDTYFCCSSAATLSVRGF